MLLKSKSLIKENNKFDFLNNKYISGKDLIEYCKDYLDDVYNKNYLFKVEYILQELLNCSRYSLYAGKFMLREKDYKKLKSCLKRLRKREPVQYITNSVYFMDFKFFVDKRVLIPRPETELLIKEVIKYVDSKGLTGLDLGTGCGNIAVSIVNYLPQAYMVATDFSEEIIEVAGINVENHNVSGKVDLRYGNMFQPVADMNSQFDFIVSNPPYVSELEMQDLPSEVLYEPVMALNGGKQGLEFYKRIIDESDKFLKPGGYVFLEIGENQKKSICEYLMSNKKMRFLKSVSDYNKKDRILVISKVD